MADGGGNEPAPQNTLLEGMGQQPAATPSGCASIDAVSDAIAVAKLCCDGRGRERCPTHRQMFELLVITET